MSETPSQISLFPSPDLASIAAKLQETAQALLSYSQSQQPQQPTPAKNKNAPRNQPSEFPQPIEAGYARGEFHDEIRCYRLPSNTVKKEYELLLQYKQNDFFKLANQVYDELATTIVLMQNADENAEFSGFDLYMMSENLSRPLNIFNTICSQLADFELVQKTTIPA